VSQALFYHPLVANCSIRLYTAAGTIPPPQQAATPGRSFGCFLRNSPTSVSRSLTAKAIHRLARFLGGEVGICGGKCLSTVTSTRSGLHGAQKATGSPIPSLHRRGGTRLLAGAEDAGSIGKGMGSDLGRASHGRVRGPLSKPTWKKRAHAMCNQRRPGCFLARAVFSEAIPVHREGTLRVVSMQALSKNWGRPEDIQDSTVALAEWLRKAGIRSNHSHLAKRRRACVDVARRAELPSPVSPRCFSHEAFLSRSRTWIYCGHELARWYLAAVANVPLREPRVPA